jgi:hypothetical protein
VVEEGTTFVETIAVSKTQSTGLQGNLGSIGLSKELCIGQQK